MTRLLRGCVACVRTRRSHTDNLRRVLPWFCIFLFAAAAEAQVQVDLKFKRLQYIAYEPVVATVAITNLAGRDIELHDAEGNPGWALRSRAVRNSRSRRSAVQIESRL